MADVSCSRTIAAGPTEIWEVLSDFGTLSAWAEGVDHSCVINSSEDADPLGLTRRVQVGRYTYIETIVAFAPPRLLAYAIAGVPSAMSASNRWNLRPDSDGRTTVTLTSSAQMKARLLRPIADRFAARLLARRSEALLNSLAKHCEEKT